MGLLSNRVREEDLQPGDHIYSWRFAYTYAHHGIYVGDDSVIHFTRGQGEETGTGTCLDKIFSSSLSPSQTSSPCTKCGVNKGRNGVVLTCLECFLSGQPLYRFQYNENALIFLAKARGGMCTLAMSDTPETVLHRSRYLLANGFGCYHIFHNNCEDFAVYCRTGLLVIERRSIGRSGQAISFLGAPLAAVFSSPLRCWCAERCRKDSCGRSGNKAGAFIADSTSRHSVRCSEPKWVGEWGVPWRMIGWQTR
ncbi:hypothetical protein GOP47_0008490 [Adiantum capillus-veneris]|uniref:LRAT domain-containing protein n=1 Tax=Adiantum capillus-veneris TaxID=13818 RepID=A0A9D4UYF2_ADICA|nr:hypothetical protein GOP47_0008490 [Adiantum capillus-veneris]